MTRPARTVTRQTTTRKRVATSDPRRVGGRDDVTDVLVELPGGQARISIEAKAGVRRTASSWLRVVEELAGTSLSPEELRAELGAAEPVGTQLTPTEQDELAAAGASRVSGRNADAARAEHVGWQVVTLAGALDVAEVAQLLGVDPTRVRQRLRARTLYGLRVQGRSWRLPRFQFDETGREIPHLGAVLRALPDTLHPRSVEGFLLSPQPELSTDGEPTGPRDWLRGGGPADPVVELAAALAAQ